MNKKKIAFFALGMASFGIPLSLVFMSSPIQAKADITIASSDSSSVSSTTSSSSSVAPYDYVITTQVGYTDGGQFKLASARGTVDANDGFYEADKPESFKAYVYSNPDFDVNGSKITVFEYVATAVWYTVNGNESVQAVIKSKENVKYVEIPLTEKGQYLIKAYFDDTNNLKVTDVSNINWAALLTWDNLIKLIEWVLVIFLGSGFFITFLKSKKIQSATTNQITEIVTRTLDSKTTETFEKFFKSTLGPLLEQYNIKFSDMSSTMNTLLKCFTLSQENTPQARLAIAEELEKLKTNDAETTAKVKAIVNQAIAENEAKAEANKKAIEDAKKANNDIKPIDGGETSESETPKKGIPTE